MTGTRSGPRRKLSEAPPRPARVDDLPRLVALPPRPDAVVPFVETPHTRAFLLAPGATPPQGTDAVVELPDGGRFAYVPRAPSEDAPRELAIDPTLRGNQFRPLHETTRALGALLSLAASRRLDSGPESERMFLFLRGPGLLSLENGDALRFGPGMLGVVPAGEPARLWAQGPEDMLALVLQPRAPPQERRTLAGEIAKRRPAAE